MRNTSKGKGLVFGTMSGANLGGTSTLLNGQSLRAKSNVTAQFGKSLNQKQPTTTTGVGFSGRTGTLRRR
tara:strand:+ start:2040 stop:2249 length:210 start_codon:yes stop_codon:yes gene_type:complete